MNTSKEKLCAENENIGWYDFKGHIPYIYYGRLLDIASDHNIITFDINDVISYVIKNFPSSFDQK